MQTLKHRTSRFKDNHLFPAEYHLAVEELLEIYIADAPYAVIMRLPGDDLNLAAGFCFSEGIIKSRDDLVTIKRCEANGSKSRVLVHLRQDRPKDNTLPEEWPVYVSHSSSGLCGRSKADEIFRRLDPVATSHRLQLRELLALKSLFETKQTIFQLTGATHSASVFDLDRKMLAFAEDIGRHNAFDKVIGRLVLQGATQDAFLAIVSSRLSFEMVQKAAVLGLEVFCGLSAPTSMAVSMAEQLNITLIGFLRENSMSIYTHPERILNQQRGSLRTSIHTSSPVHELNR